MEHPAVLWVSQTQNKEFKQLKKQFYSPLEVFQPCFWCSDAASHKPSPRHCRSYCVCCAAAVELQHSVGTEQSSRQHAELYMYTLITISFLSTALNYWYKLTTMSQNRSYFFCLNDNAMYLLSTVYCFLCVHFTFQSWRSSAQSCTSCSWPLLDLSHYAPLSGPYCLTSEPDPQYHSLNTYQPINFIVSR